MRLDVSVAAPSYARAGDAGVDLSAMDPVVLSPAGGRAMVATGLALELPEGFAGLVLPRSGLAWRNGVTVLNAPGLIDSGYRDEIRVLLLNTDPEAPYEIQRGDRVAQLVVVPVAHVGFAMVDSLGTSQRGTGGFGHTGR